MLLCTTVVVYLSSSLGLLVLHDGDQSIPVSEYE